MWNVARPSVAMAAAALLRLSRRHKKAIKKNSDVLVLADQKQTGLDRRHSIKSWSFSLAMAQ